MCVCVCVCVCVRACVRVCMRRGAVGRQTSVLGVVGGLGDGGTRVFRRLIRDSLQLERVQSSQCS